MYQKLDRNNVCNSHWGSVWGIKMAFDRRSQFIVSIEGALMLVLFGKIRSGRAFAGAGLVSTNRWPVFCLARTPEREKEREGESEKEREQE